MNVRLNDGQLFPFHLAPLTVHIGAEVSGIDLTQELPAPTIEALRTALLERKVLFFRDQNITTAQHVAFARRFGELEIHPFVRNKSEYPEVIDLRHDENNPARENAWHSDVTWRHEPSMGSILRAVEIPPVGGDTMFSDMYAAYDGLPDDLKQKIEGRTAIHDILPFRQRMRERGASAEEIAAFDAKYPPAEHPIVRTHPETKKKCLYVNIAFTVRIVGMEPAESEALLHRLYRQASIPEYQCRFRWQKNSIAFWDNRACQHYAVADYFPAVRRMERATIVGDRPY